LIAAVLLCLGAPSAAFADDTAAYEVAFERGTELFDKGEWAAAREEFQRAYRLDPKPLLLFNIGSTYRKEGNYIEALFYYHRYLEEAPPDASLRAFAEKVVSDLTAKIEAQEAAEGKSDRADASSPRRRDPGPSRGGSGAMRVAGLVFVVLGGASVGYGVFEGRRASQLAAEIDDAPDGTPWSDELQDTFDRGQAAETRSQIFTVAGGVAVLAGVTMYLLGRGGSSRGASDAGSVAIAPRIGPGGVGVSIAGGF
jgi:tetratricopeptide (TPR) repeat protein